MVESRYASTYVNPSGPGDARPTAFKVLQDLQLGPGSLSHLSIVITGSTSGIGFETARALYSTGARLLITARTAESGQAAADKIEAGAGSKGAKIEVVELVLDDLSSVRSAGAIINEKLGAAGLNVLICNAGIMAAPFSRTKDGFESQFGTNHLGHFLLFNLLQPALVKGAETSKASGKTFESRVVALSSTGHRISGIHVGNYDFHKDDDPYNKWVAYGQSKTANIYMANEIERRYAGQGIHGLSLHPGLIGETNLKRSLEPEDIAAAGIGKEDAGMYMNSEQGAATSVWAAVSDELEGRGGLYLNNVAVAEPAAADARVTAAGYGKWAYDEQLEGQLWGDSEALVGLRT